MVGGSALAEAEVEYHDKVSFSIDVSYPTSSEDAVLAAFSDASGTGSVCAVIWTTTPMDSTIILSHFSWSRHTIVLVQFEVNGESRRVIIAEELLEAFLSRAKIEVHEVVGHCMGSDLENLVFKHPFYDRDIPVLLGDHVTLDAGTGMVHTAPDHGLEDFAVCNKYGISTINPMDDKGVFRESVELFAGIHVYKVDGKVIETVKANGNLLSEGKLEHSYAHCWRN